MKLLVMAITLAALAAPLAAQTPPSQKSDPKQRDPNELVCRSGRVTGSLVQTKKICRTRVEWKREREAIESMEGRTGCSDRTACGGS